MYKSPEELWEAVARRTRSNTAAQASATRKAASVANATQPDTSNGPVWYTSAVQYWDAQAATDDGVLGGYGFVSDADVRDSLAFLKKVMGDTLEEAAAKGNQLVAVGTYGTCACSPPVLFWQLQKPSRLKP